MARVVSIIWLGIVLFGLAGVALLLTLALLLSQSGVILPSSGTPNLAASALPPGGAARLGLVALRNGVGQVVAGVALLPAARRNAARLLPIEPSRHVHGIALSLVLGATIVNLGQLLALGGRPPMLEMVALIPEQSATQQLLGIVYPFLWNVPGAIIAAGWPVARTFRGAVRRLGLVRPTVRWVATGIVVGLAMVVGATLLDTAISMIWNILGWERTDMSAFGNLLRAAMSPVGAVLIGVTAGLGEEMIIRGALQPRLGIILSNLFFTSLHAYQYSLGGSPQCLRRRCSARRRARSEQHHNVEYCPWRVQLHAGHAFRSGIVAVTLPIGVETLKRKIWLRRSANVQIYAFPASGASGKHLFVHGIGVLRMRRRCYSTLLCILCEKIKPRCREPFDGKVQSASNSDQTFIPLRFCANSVEVGVLLRRYAWTSTLVPTAAQLYNTAATSSGRLTHPWLKRTPEPKLVCRGGRHQCW